jgi:peptidoglycan lytic transglycosylase
MILQSSLTRVLTSVLGCAVVVTGLVPMGAKARPVNYASSAVQTAFVGRYSDAQAMALTSGNPSVQKLVEWILLREEVESAGYDRLMRFALANPHWPGVEALRRRAERMRPREVPAPLEARLAERKPATVYRMLALARTCLAQDDRRGAQAWAALAWRKVGSDPVAERRVLKEFGPLLSLDDHKHRLWRFIGAGETNAAIRAAALLPTEYQQLAKVARELIRGERNIVDSFQRLSSALRAESAMQFALARYYRQIDQYEKAADILLKISSDRSKVLDPKQVWPEREVIARELLDRSNPKHWRTSYTLVAAHGLEPGVEAAEAEFLAGWIAFRFLHESETALGHFRRLQSIVTTRTERARAAYWLGRTYDSVGRGSAAHESYTQAALAQTVYYGQLAREALGQGSAQIIIPEIRPSAVIQSRVANDDLVRAYRILARINRPGERRAFLESFADYFKTPEEMAAAAGIVWKTKGAYEALQLAKAASLKGVDIDSWSYPINAMPSWKGMGPPIEKSFVFGLARQESEFNPQAKSRAGARGLMQLMPNTARLIALQYKIAYDQALLTTDPDYNVTLGAAHLGDLVKRFRGSYVLALAAYNAGPRRAIEWVERFGDPRSSEIDPVDWIESIPFSETRFYIQKVLQNTQVYRSRLQEPATQGILADLSRGRPAIVPASMNGFLKHAVAALRGLLCERLRGCCVDVAPRCETKIALRFGPLKGLLTAHAFAFVQSGL